MTQIHDDPLADLFMAAAGDRQQTERDERAKHQARVAMETAPVTYREACPKCAGSGQVRWGTCFKCNGTGRLTFATSPEHRAAGRQRTAARATARQVEAQAWREAHQAEIAWLNAAAERQHANAHQGRTVWQFPVDLAEKLAEWGTLTDGQLAAVRKCMVRDAERRTERQQVATATAPACDASKIEEAFARARANAAGDRDWVRNLALRLDTFIFSPAGANSRNPGAIYVKDKETKTYLGKIVEGSFRRVRECSDEQETRIIAAAADPAAAAIAYGQRYKFCACCGRELTNAVSRARGIGPICAERFGF